jgi:hypothetical protein
MKKNLKRKIFAIVVVFVVLLFFVVFTRRPDDNDIDPDDVVIPTPISASTNEVLNEANNPDALEGYNVLIADRGNNRLIEVTPDKKIVWQYSFNLSKPGLGADDAFFTDNGNTIIVNLELYHIIEQIDYQSKKVIWSYGVPGIPGSNPGYLDRPDDAYKLSNGDVINADIKNCRVIEISPDKNIVRQYGVTGVCKNSTGYLNKPNGDTPLANGHILISNINSNSVVELNQNWKQVLDLKVPLKYPSDPQPTLAGNILISDYSNPGKIIEITRSGNIVWQYYVKDGPGKLNSPSLAIELPNGNILANDDLNHRIIVIDKNSKKIVWQYGVTGKPGSLPGQLSIPDGVDIIKRPAVIIPTHTVGQITRSAQNFIGTEVKIQGYLLKSESGYIIVSDEPAGSISQYDLPITGLGIIIVEPNKKYTFQGIFLGQGLVSSNQNPNHLELSQLPEYVP